MSATTDMWHRRKTRSETEVIDILVEKLLDARLAYEGADTDEQRANTRPWAEALLANILNDPIASRKIAAVISPPPGPRTPIDPKPPQTVRQLIASIRRHLAIIRVSDDPELLAIADALDAVLSRLEPSSEGAATQPPAAGTEGGE